MTPDPGGLAVACSLLDTVKNVTSELGPTRHKDEVTDEVLRIEWRSGCGTD